MWPSSFLGLTDGGKTVRRQTFGARGAGRTAQTCRSAAHEASTIGYPPNQALVLRPGAACRAEVPTVETTCGRDRTYLTGFTGRPSRSAMADNANQLTYPYRTRRCQFDGFRLLGRIGPIRHGRR